MRIAEKLDNHEHSVHFTPPFLILFFRFFFSLQTRAGSISSTETMITYWNEALEWKILCGGRLIRSYKIHIMKYFLSLFMPRMCIYIFGYCATQNVYIIIMIIVTIQKDWKFSNSIEIYYTFFSCGFLEFEGFLVEQWWWQFGVEWFWKVEYSVFRR